MSGIVFLLVAGVIIFSYYYKNKQKQTKPKLDRKILYHIFKDAGFYNGRHFGSKSFYVHEHPDDKVVFNACLFYADEFNHKKEYQDVDPIWCGDLNLTLEMEKLQAIANRIGSFVVTKEGRYVSTIYSRE